ncbi:MAG: hypothetical protein WCG61_04725 [Chlorobium sp.]
MSNKFIESIKTANENRWCTTPYCFCGAREYRQHLIDLRDYDSMLSVGPVAALSNLNPSELTKIDNWQNPLLVAIIDMNWQREQILKSWLPKIRDDITFTDFVLFKIIRNCSKDNVVIKEWIEACLILAKETNSFSLTESLLLVLGQSSLEHPELIEQAKVFAKSSPQMRRVLWNACKIEAVKKSVLASDPDDERWADQKITVDYGAVVRDRDHQDSDVERYSHPPLLLLRLYEDQNKQR